MKEIFVSGGEPFLLEDIDQILLSCAAAGSATVLTNGMLFTGHRLESLRELRRNRVTLQISLDSAMPELHHIRRGPGTWAARTGEGIRRVRALGLGCGSLRPFRLMPRRKDSFLEEEEIAAESRIIRRIALRGSATQGVAVARADLLPEITITV